MSDNDGGAVALVTGSGRGIGFEVSRQLTQRDMTVLLGVRNLEKGESAAWELAAEGLDVRARAVDVSDGESFERLASEVEDEFGGLERAGQQRRRLRGLVGDGANRGSGICPRGLRDEPVRRVARVPGVSARDPVQRPRSDRQRLQRSRISRRYRLRADDEPWVAGELRHLQGGAERLTSKLAAELEGTRLPLVNSACPGLTATAPGMEAMGARLIPEGAASVVWAALLPDDGPTGGFFRDGKPLPW